MQDLFGHGDLVSCLAPFGTMLVSNQDHHMVAFNYDLPYVQVKIPS